MRIVYSDDSHETPYLIFSNIGKMSRNVSSAAVVIGALRVKYMFGHSNNKNLWLVSQYINLIENKELLFMVHAGNGLLLQLVFHKAQF